MKRFFDAELENFRSLLLLMGEKATRQVHDAMQALALADAGLADRVIAADDELDLLEMKIDDEAVRYMSLRAPVATELRLVIVGMKASHDLERAGDEATSIAKRVIRLAAEPPLKPLVDLPIMVTVALEMLGDALDCFTHDNSEKALSVCHRDAAVDQLNRQIFRDLTRLMIENPGSIGRALELTFISKSIERIADHATNIAEEMIYLTKGRDVRHSSEVKKARSAAVR